jgi:cytochrome c-type biogenesis protein CcmH/NrfF
MEPQWLTIVSWAALGLGFGSGLVILADAFLLRNRQQMWIMNVVHPVTALYWGPVWVWLYVRHGRKSGQKVMRAESRRLIDEGAHVEELKRKGGSTEPHDLRPWHIASAVSHCGAGCTLGDIGGEWILFAFGAPMLGILGTYGWEIIVDFVLAWTLGIAFQYFTIVPMRENLGKLDGIWQAIKVDTASIVAFQLGLFGWMALSYFVLWQPPLTIDTSGHWFMMQIGMIVGFFTAWPVNRSLVRSGIKEKMDHRTHLATMIEQMREGGETRDAPSAREREAAASGSSPPAAAAGGVRPVADSAREEP